MPEVRSLIPPGGFLAGWLNYCNSARGAFKFPDSYALFAMLACASAAINRRIQVNAESVPAPYTNLFVVLYGPSASGKGTAMREAVHLLADAIPEAPVLPDDFSMSALLGRLTKQSEEAGKCGGLILAEELSDLIGGAEYRLENTRSLSKMWDCPSVYVRDTRMYDEEVVRNPYLSGVFCTAPDWAQDIDPRTLSGGYFRRNIWCVEYAPKLMDAEPYRDRALRLALVKVMRERIGPKAFEGTHMALSEEARALNRKWKRDVLGPLQKVRSDREGALLSTSEEMAFKLGAIVQVLEGGGVRALAAAPLGCAQRLMEATWPGAFQVMASLVPTPYARMRAAILRMIRSAGGRIANGLLDASVSATTGMPPKYVRETKVSMVEDGTLVSVGGSVEEAK